MQKHAILFLIVTTLLLLCCSCATPEQTSDPWAYQKDDGTWPEFNRKAYLQVMYVYENLRPDEAFPDEQLASSPDEQMLRLIDSEYKDFDTEPYMPREDEVQYDEMKQIVLSMVETLQIADRAPDLCYSSLMRADFFRKADPQWMTLLCYEEGYHYRFYINAKDGSFQSWRRFPPGSWTYANVLPKAPHDPPPERTDEELLTAAEAYAKAALVTEASDIIESTTVVTSASPHVKKDVTVILHPYYVYQISVDYDDLSITAVVRK